VSAKRRRAGIASVSTCAESSPTEKFLILQNRNRPTVKFYFLRKSDAHPYRLVRELTPGNGSIERHTHPSNTFRALSGEGVSFACCLLFVCCLMDLPLAK
jgi:hypothetical protein